MEPGDHLAVFPWDDERDIPFTAEENIYISKAFTGWHNNTVSGQAAN